MHPMQSKENSRKKQQEVTVLCEKCWFVVIVPLLAQELHLCLFSIHIGGRTSFLSLSTLSSLCLS